MLFFTLWAIRSWLELASIKIKSTNKYMSKFTSQVIGLDGWQFIYPQGIVSRPSLYWDKENIGTSVEI